MSQQHIIDALEVCTLDFVTYIPQRFLALHLETGRLLYIIGLTTNGNWLSADEHLYTTDSITTDLIAHTRQEREADLCDRFDDGDAERHDPHLDAFV